MIVLDTNILSEMMRREPNRGVLRWLAAQPRETVFTTVMNRTEILYGIAAMQDGRKRHLLSGLAAAMFEEDFAGHVLPYTSQAAPHYAAIVMDRRKVGHPIEAFDALIAATVRAAGAAIATRGTGFAGCGLTVINPWELG